MADTTKRGNADAIRINVNEAHEVRYATEKWGVTEEDLREAVGAAGVMRDDVEAWLRKNGKIK